MQKHMLFDYIVKIKWRSLGILLNFNTFTVPLDGLLKSVRSMDLAISLPTK